jgi:hypothetical protein
MGTSVVFDCFVDVAFDQKEITLMKNITYGSAYNNFTKKVGTLTPDAYFPPASDNRTLRPAAAVLAHGGGFTDGESTSDGEPAFALELVSRGFVAVSINYRLCCLVSDNIFCSNNPVLNKLITIPKAGHVPFEQLFKGGDSDGPYITQLMKSLKQSMELEEAQCPTPQGCN